MSSESPRREGRRQQNARLYPSRALAGRKQKPAPAETRVVGDYLYVTLSLPEIEDPELRYAIRRRYLLVWGDNSPHSEQQFVLLPKQVDPDQHSIRFQNGVLDVRIKLRQPT